MKILITGGSGYVGSVITNVALNNNFKVKVIDALWFNKKVPLIHYSNPNYEIITGDITDSFLLDKAVEGVDYIVHTAAVVGDPASKKFPEKTRKINEEASINLTKLAEKHKVKGLLFFSTCSNYGVADEMATEESELHPLSLYAETKVNVEKHIIDNLKNVDWVIGRLSTVYGSSPRMRFDLTVNDFALKAFKNKYIDIFLPESFRPYIHVYDLACTVIELINNFSKVKNNVFNIGFIGENYQKIEIANAVKKYIPDLKIDILKEGGDKRDYKVDFSKLHKFINLKNTFNVEKSVVEILNLLNQGIITDFDNPMYYNTTPDFDK